MIELALALVAVFFILRNHATFKARAAILKSDGIADFQALPTYHQAVFHPAFWLKWTVADWREYLARRSA
jgi:hypothetical protein